MAPKPLKPIKISDLDPQTFMEILMFSLVATGKEEGKDLDNIQAFHIVKHKSEANRIAAIYFSLGTHHNTHDEDDNEDDKEESE